uniref:Uncharacterized protein n=1 Tax=Tetranychus urticae TaxID=32264 RepID=T1KXU5_TETUR
MVATWAASDRFLFVDSIDSAAPIEEQFL